ncbi:MAG TPA: DNA repair protein RecN, partial [Clostridiales bacterium]|nr:DNA repair protein RecN [Clostridiales bacterium]
AGDNVSRALKQLIKIVEYDEAIQSFLDQTTAIEGLLNDLNRDLSEYLSNLDNQEEELEEVTRRLDLINHLKSKYGNSLEQIMKYCSQCEEKLKIYRDYDEYIEKLEKKVKKAEEDLKNLCIRLSDIRKAKAKELTKKISEALVALNFLDVRFEMTFTQLNHYTAKGFDDAEFIISTNPGEPLRPLGKVASGGELSRIMLGIKSVLADKDEIETLIFDEIDVGISGRTAQKVSEQLAVIAKNHQIICITHLAQIAAMADSHFIIEKQSDGQSTETYIKEINEEESIVELSRILGGAKITESIINSAREMKQLANATKKYKL